MTAPLMAILVTQIRAPHGGFLSGFFPSFSIGGGTKRLFSTVLITCRQPVRRCKACQISHITPSRLPRH